MIKISQLQKERVLTIIKVLSELSYDVLVKADDNELSELPKNIKTMPWVPQQDLLSELNIMFPIPRFTLNE